MSQFSEEAPETLEDWNAILSNGCCCTMPTCPTPTRECESISRTATAADDDYTDAYAAWLAGGSIGDPPTKPEGYDDVLHGSWLPFTEPAGEDMTIYRTLMESEEATVAAGSVKRWAATPGDEFGEASAIWQTWTAGGADVNWTSDVWRFAYGGASCGGNGGYTVVVEFSDSGTTSGFPDFGAAIPWVEDNPPEVDPCTATQRFFVSYSRHAAAGGAATDQHEIPDSCNTGPPPPFDADPTGWTAANDWEWTDLTEKIGSDQTLGSGVSPDDVKTRAIGKMPPEWPGPAEATSCNALYTKDWPSSTDAGWPSPWPDCADDDLPIADTGTITVRKSRFRWTVPDTWAGSYFKITWDVAFFPDGYDAEDPESPQPESVSTDQTWEWTGPGDPEDADTWKSGWYEIPVPTDPGENRVVNIRYECYHGASFGVLPQVTGEAVDWSPPP